tara:strand:+ start:405 stop:572 length:168 start_codon:yes stop_codon:yes gene_type:complete
MSQLSQTSTAISLENIQLGGQYIPDFGTGLSKQSPAIQWLFIILIIFLLFSQSIF